jgi:hypothetical protein
MQWLDFSAYGAELKINVDALDKPALYVRSEGAFLDSALTAAGFHRRPRGLWFRTFEPGALAPILQSLVVDLPLVREIDMSPLDIGLNSEPVEPEECLIDVASTVERADCHGEGHREGTHEEAEALEAQPAFEQPRRALPIEQSDARERVLPNTFSGLLAELLQQEQSQDLRAPSGPRGILRRLQMFGFARGRTDIDEQTRHEPMFAEQTPDRVEADWIASIMPEDAAALTGRGDLSANSHLIAKLLDPVSAERLDRLIGRRVLMESESGSVEVVLIGTAEARAEPGLGDVGDILIVGDAGGRFGAAVIPARLEAEQAA